MIKAGVDLRGLKPQMAIAYSIAQWVYSTKAGARCRISSGVEGKHSPNSRHYSGNALDLGIRELRPEQIHPVYMTIRECLGNQFDVVLEPDHIHMEFDPKEPEKKEDA